jgi:hypothetical protein
MSNPFQQSQANLTQSQLAHQVSNQFQSAYNQYAAQGQQQSQQVQWAAMAAQSAMSGLLMQKEKNYMINGVLMTFEQFLDEVAPGDDNAMRTFLTLKYSGLES